MTSIAAVLLALSAPLAAAVTVLGPLIVARLAGNPQTKVNCAAHAAYPAGAPSEGKASSDGS